MSEHLQRLAKSISDIDVADNGAFGDRAAPKDGGTKEKEAHQYARMLVQMHHHANADCNHDHVASEVRERHPDSEHSDESLMRTMAREHKNLKGKRYATKEDPQGGGDLTADATTTV